MAETVALIGDSAVCARVVKAAEKLGFSGRFVGVHPHRVLPGVRTVTSVTALADDLGTVPDLAYVAVPPQFCVEVVEQLAALGCRTAVVYSSGFAETATELGRQRQHDLVRAAGAMNLIGPNCYGLLNYVDGLALWPDEHGGRRLPAGQRGVAIVAQSSSLAISMSMADHGLPIAYLSTVGNAAQSSAFDVAALLLQQPATSAVGLLVESVADLPGLQRLAALSRSERIPVVAVVLGRSSEAARVVLSHSAALHTDSALTSTLLRHVGIGEVADVEELLGTLALLHCHGPLHGTEITSLSCSGGEASLLADAAAATTVRFPPLTPRKRAELRLALTERVTLDNPLDYHTYVWGDEAAMTVAFTAMLGQPDEHADLNVFFADLPRADRCDDTDWLPSVRAFTAACRATGAKGAVTAAMSNNLRSVRADELIADGLPVVAPPRVAVAAVQAAAQVGASWGRPAPAPLHGPGHRAGSSNPVPTVLTEAEGKTLLRRAGIDTPDGLVTADPAEVGRWAADRAGPVVVKALGLAHKSEQHAVRLNLDAEQAVAAARELVTVSDSRTAAGVLVEEQVSGVIAELIVSLDDDPVLGPYLTLGTGGVLVELFADVVHVVLPCTDDDVRQALSRLRGYPLLTGFRGRPPADLDQVVAVAQRLARLAAPGCPDHVVSAEINPLVVTRSRAVAVDALLTVRPVRPEDPSPADDRPVEEQS